MTDPEESFHPRNERDQQLRTGKTGNGPVLLWVQRAQRVSGNLAANRAVEIANALDRPVIAFFCLVPDYPRATERAYHFMAEGLQELPHGFAQRGIGWILQTGDPAEVIPRLVSRFDAAGIVTDQAPTTPGRIWKQVVAERVNVPVLAVDADVIVPSALFPNLEWAARTIRPKLLRALPAWSDRIDDPAPNRRSALREGEDPLDIVSRLALDRAAAPSPRLKGGQSIARSRLNRFCETQLRTYDRDRNRSDIDGSSLMSPYLHFGQIGPHEILHRVVDTLGEDFPEAHTAFLNELVVQRELAINFALRQPGFDTFDGIPDWGKKTLAKHAGDPRPIRYSHEQLERGLTADPLWNAAQRQMVAEGFMPNRLRMYWAKQLLMWTASAEEAFDIAVRMNDRYFVDGRDANGYAGIAWAIGGRHDRPFPPERPIFGLIRPMGAKGMRKHFDVDAYISSIENQYPHV